MTGGGSFGFLSKFDGSNWTSYTASNSGSVFDWGGVASIAVDKNDNVWIGTAYLNKFDGTNWTSYTTTNSGLLGNFPSCIAVDNNNSIWIGTSEGISVLKR